MDSEKVTSEVVTGFIQKLPCDPVRSQFWASFSALSPDEQQGFEDLIQVETVGDHLKYAAHISPREMAIIGMSPLARTALNEDPEVMNAFTALARIGLGMDLSSYDHYADSPEDWIRDNRRQIIAEYAIKAHGDNLIDGIVDPKNTVAVKKPSLYKAGVEIIRKVFEALSPDVRDFNRDEADRFRGGAELDERGDLRDFVENLSK